MTFSFSPQSGVVLDIELLIEEIRKRPVLWDRRYVEYNNKVQKEICWEEILKTVFEDGKELGPSEKRLRIEILKSKWRNLRDSYNKELMMQQKVRKRKLKYKKPYRFAELLSFLNEQFKRKGSKSSSESSSLSEDEIPIKSLAETSKSDNETPRKKIKQSLPENISIHKINIKQFIKEVKNRPPLWNNVRKSADPTDRGLRTSLWMEICAVVIENWDSLDRSNKSLRCAEIKKKWRNLRDGFSRAINKQRMSQDGYKRKTYRFYKDLKFIEPQYLNKYSDEESLSQIEVDCNPSEFEEETYEDPKTFEQTYEVQSGETYEDPNSHEVLKTCEELKTEEHKCYDEDVSFTEMLVPLLKKLTEDQKHYAQVEILNVLKKARSFDPLSNISCININIVKDEN